VLNKRSSFLSKWKGISFRPEKMTATVYFTKGRLRIGMKSVRRARRIALASLVRENEEQLATLNNLLEHFSFPKSLFVHDVVIEQTTPSSLRPRISELREELEQKQANYAKEYQKIAKYVKQAHVLEQELARNEKEKAKLLTAVQQKNNVDSSVMADELDSRIIGLSENLCAEKKESETIKRLHHGLRKELQKRSSESPDCENPDLTQSDDFPDLKEILMEKKTTVEQLQRELAGLQKIMKNLRQDNETIRLVLKKVGNIAAENANTHIDGNLNLDHRLKPGDNHPVTQN
jgi:chromosome segregation ATPase